MSCSFEVISRFPSSLVLVESTLTLVVIGGRTQDLPGLKSVLTDDLSRVQEADVFDFVDTRLFEERWIWEEWLDERCLAASTAVSILSYWTISEC